LHGRGAATIPGVTSALSQPVRRFLEERRFAVIATVNDDGSPQQAVVWYLIGDDGNTLIINSAEGRRWPTNLRRDQRISLAVEDGLEWVSVNGTVEIVDDHAQSQADIAAMARLNDPPEVAERSIRNQFERQRRVSFRLRPTRIHAELEG
jgi:PPOX class probable F420-dependent enzyme